MTNGIAVSSASGSWVVPAAPSASATTSSGKSRVDAEARAELRERGLDRLASGCVRSRRRGTGRSLVSAVESGTAGAHDRCVSALLEREDLLARLDTPAPPAAGCVRRRRGRRRQDVARARVRGAADGRVRARRLRAPDDADAARAARSTSPRELGGDLAAASSRPAASRGRGAARRAAAPAVLVLEDLHWADEATLDVAARARAAHRRRRRRSCSPPTATTRSPRDHPLRVVLGELASAPGGRAPRRCRRSRSTPCASSRRRTAPTRDAIHARTAGQPVLRHRGARRGRRRVPETVRDAVLARARALAARRARLLDVVALVPAAGRAVAARRASRRTELDAARRVPRLRRAPRRPRRASRSGTSSPGSRSRARSRRAAGATLHAAILRALVRRTATDSSRLAHHAEEAGDDDAVLAHAPRRRASAPPRRARTARRRRSTRGRSATRSALAGASGPSCSPPTRARRELTRRLSTTRSTARREAIDAHRGARRPAARRATLWRG